MKAAWECKTCEVKGTDPEPARCWSCDSEDVRVTARYKEAGTNPSYTPHPYGWFAGMYGGYRADNNG